MSNATMTPKDSGVQLEDLLLNPEVQNSLVVIMNELPKVATLMTVLGKGMDVAKEVVSDPDMLGDIEEKVQGAVGKLQGTIGKLQGTVGAKGMDIWSAVKEARQRADRDCSRVGLFGLLRLMKDPTVQSNLRFVQAFLSVMSERAAKSGKPNPCK